MSKPENSDLDEGPPRRVDVQILIAHPTFAPADITAALGLEPLVAHRAKELMHGLGDDIRTLDQDTARRASPVAEEEIGIQVVIAQKFKKRTMKTVTTRACYYIDLSATAVTRFCRIEAAQDSEFAD